MKQHVRVRRAFTLIEIVVTIAIFIAALAAYTIAVYSVFLTIDAAHEELGLRIASNELEKLRSGGYDALPASGAFTDTQLSSLSNSSATLAVSAYDAQTKNVSVTVSWSEASSGTRTITLNTLITKVGGLK